MVVLGVIIFAGASALCGATPHGGAAEAWLVAFRALQGLGGAIMFPAAIAIVVVTFDLRSRGRALALFFGIAGGLTAIGPIAGGYLIEWTWRAIFWINIPVALIALALIAISRPPNEARPAPMDYRGLALIVGGVGLSVFGFQQSALWGWGNPVIWASIAVGLILLVVFYFVERRTESRSVPGCPARDRTPTSTGLGPGRLYPLLSSGSMISSGPVASPVVSGSGAAGSTCLT
jgi:MFS family permease